MFITRLFLSSLLIIVSDQNRVGQLATLPFFEPRLPVPPRSGVPRARGGQPVTILRIRYCHLQVTFAIVFGAQTQGQLRVPLRVTDGGLLFDSTAAMTGDLQPRLHGFIHNPPKIHSHPVFRCKSVHGDA